MAHLGSAARFKPNTLAQHSQPEPYWPLRSAAVWLGALILGLLLGAGAPNAGAQIQRLLGLDVSCWQGGISQTVWNNLCTNDNRKFVILRSSRGGTTGEDHRSCGYPSGDTTYTNLSQRYDDPYFVQNINFATAAGMFAGMYHFSRPDITATTGNAGGIANNGTDEADHFIQMAGAWMRPGYLPPMHDLEAGDGIRTDNEMAQFCIDFSNRIYEKMGIRPSIYLNGNYAANILQTASAPLPDQIAKPPPNLPTNSVPSVVSPTYPYLISARWPNQTDPNSIDVQNAEPKDSYTPIYGPWDDYGVTHPWKIWQYASTMHLASYSTTANLDVDVARGGYEFVKDQLIPAIWLYDLSGDWSTLTNWNSGQTPVAPVLASGQVTPTATGPLPTPRLPGAAGTGPTSGQNDTVILERSSANITVTLSSGTHNIRKLYQRETLNITGGSLTINYAPSADSTTFGAQFSGPVTLSGAGSLSVHTLQVDSTQTFTVTGGALTFNTINLMPHSTTPAKLLVSGDASFNSLSNLTATIANGTGTGSSGLVDLGGGTRVFNVGDSTAEVDVSVAVPISNGALSKAGPGTLRLTAANTFSGGTIVSAGRLLVNNTSGSGTGTGAVTVNGGILGGTGTIAGAVTVNAGGMLSPGAASAFGTLTLNSAPGFGGTNLMRIDRNGGASLADKLVLSSGTLSYGGRLVVSNSGATLTGGEVFTLFSAGAYSGAFAATDLPPLSADLIWDLGNLAVNGTISVITNTLPTAPSISSGPDSLVLAQGQNATFSVSAQGTQPLAYQWRFNSSDLGGATLSAYTRPAVQPADAGSYSVVVTNTYGSRTSAVATLTVIVPPTIATQPVSQTVTQATSATFSVEASGTGPFSYQWRFNGGNLGGATASSYTRANAQPADAGSYSVVVTNAAGSAISSDAVLTVISLPAITTQPQGQTVVLGGTASFNVVATGTAPLGYQWRFGGTDIGGATASSYSRPNLQPSDGGDYSVRVSNAYGTVLSSTATLVVDTNVTLPVITAQPQSQTVIAGQNATFTVTATNKAPLSYQWRFNAAPIAGATASAYTLAGAQTSQAGSYSVVITNIIGSTNSADAVLAVNFSLTATATAGGTVGKSPDQASYAPNTTVSVSASPNSGYIFVGWSGDASGTNNPIDLTLTTNKAVTAAFASIATDLILDNTDPAVSFVGDWQTGTSSVDKYGPDYRFASTAVGGLSNVTYRPYIYTPGYYDVSVWYPQGSNRATNAPWSVVYNGGSVNVPVNQTINGGTWVLLAAARPFALGTGGYVSVSNDTGYSGKVVMADAVRFTLVTNFTLTTAATVGGAVYRNPDQTNFVPGSGATLVAAPVQGWNFSGWSGSASGLANPLTVTLNSSLAITGNFTSTVPDLIVDNPQAAKTGTWTTRTTGTGYYGVDFQTATSTTGSATATATFTPTIVTAGNYDVYVWYPTPNTGTTSANAQFLVSYSGGTITVAVNQQTSQQSWVLVGSGLKFSAGTSGSVQLANNTGESNRRVLADAVRWVYSASQASPPVIAAQPQSQTTGIGSSIAFSVGAFGDAPLSYQWRFNGGNLSGATSSSYPLNNVQAGNAGSYSVAVTNNVGSVTSSVATLSVGNGPSITSQPQSRTNNAGTDASFSVTATGDAPLAFQWRKNGASISGATASSYTRPSVQAGDAGSYSVIVTNPVGSLASADAVLTVNVPPGITGQPQSRTNVAGTAASFTVAATGTAPLSYQWRWNGGDISGATASSYTRAGVQPADAGSFSVVVTNSVGTITSGDAVLTVTVPPGISGQPQSRTNNAGTDAAFAVTATGTAPLSYQWRLNGAGISGATASAYTRPSVQGSDAGSYSVIVTNAAGSLTSADAILTVNLPPGITGQPQSRTNNAGSDAAFSVTATGAAPLGYQWRFNGTNLSGATVSAYTRFSAKAADAGSYMVVITNFLGSITSAEAVLSINVPPGITASPQSRTNVAGTDALFSVTATGTAPLTYEWRRNGGTISGATDSAYTRSNVQTADAGTYLVIVRNTAGSTTSADAILTIAVAPGITAQPQSRTNNAGTSASFSVTATGTPPLSYQWRWNGGAISGATASSYTRASVQTGDAGSYSVIVTNIAGSIISDDAILTVNVAPAITGQPQSRTNNAGTDASFTVTATGTAPLSYQWRWNGNSISGATASSYTRPGVQTGDAGSYSVIVTNIAGSIASDDAILTVNVAPSIADQPQSRTNIAGTDASFSVTATGTAPLSYQWRWNGGAISDATGSSYTRPNVQAGDAGSYSVIVTNIAGSIVSDDAILTVNVAPAIADQPQSRTNIAGTDASFSVTATGTAPLSYQWYVNGTNLLAGATDQALTLTNVQPADAGSYSVQITNVAGSVTSADALLTVNVPVAIAAQPQSRTNIIGSDAGFSVSATGTAPLIYQWRFNDGDIPGATASAYTRANVQTSDAGSYSVLVSNLVGSVTSAEALLAVLPPAPHIDSITLLSGEGFQLQITGGPGNFAIDATPDLSTWSELTNFTVPGVVFQFTDPDTNQITRFYRVRTLP